MNGKILEMLYAHDPEMRVLGIIAFFKEIKMDIHDRKITGVTGTSNAEDISLIMLIGKVTIVIPEGNNAICMVSTSDIVWGKIDKYKIPTITYHLDAERDKELTKSINEVKD